MEVDVSSELAYAIVNDVAPEELPMFEIMRDAFVQDPQRVRLRGTGDEAMSFGSSDAASMITPLVLLFCNNFVRDLVAEMAKPAAHGAAQAILQRIAKLVRRERDVEPFTTAQLDKIKITIERIARSNKLPEIRIKSLTDATLATLSGRAVAS